MPYPEDPAELNDREWAEYLFYRDNPKGAFAERWVHSTGCRQWFNMLRDTVTYEIQAVYPARRAPRPDSARRHRCIDRKAPSMTTQQHRLSTGGRIDRSITWRFTVDGEEFTGHPGDTVASALLANGRVAAGNSLYEAAPAASWPPAWRSPTRWSGSTRFPGHVAESMLPATTVTLVDGLAADLLSGLGRLDPADDRAEYDKKYVHTDVLVIGGGPAGLAAARAAVAHRRPRDPAWTTSPNWAGRCCPVPPPRPGRDHRGQAGPGVGGRRRARARLRRRSAPS